MGYIQMTIELKSKNLNSRSFHRIEITHPTSLSFNLLTYQTNEEISNILEFPVSFRTSYAEDVQTDPKYI